MSRAGRVAFALIALIGSVSLVQAQEPPNLVGTWKGQALAVGTGANADLCYDHIYPRSKVVACCSLTRQ